MRVAVESGHDLEEVAELSWDGGSKIPITALMVAAGSTAGATVDTVQFLLDLGADPGHVEAAQSAATFACCVLRADETTDADFDRFRLVTEAGAPLDLSSEIGSTLVDTVARRGPVALLQELLSRGGRPSGSAPQHRNTVWGPNGDDLRLAVESGSLGGVDMLGRHGVDLEVCDEQGQSLLFFANSVSMVRFLVARGLDLERRDHLGFSPLEMAIFEGLDGLDRLQALVDAGADVNATQDRGYTVFMGAASGADPHPRVLQILAEAGANPHAVSELGWNAFHAGIDASMPEPLLRSVYQYLIGLGVDLECRTVNGETPLAMALRSGMEMHVGLLCELGANVNARGHVLGFDSGAWEYEDSPLVFGALTSLDPLGFLRPMLRARVDADACDLRGRRAIECVDILLATKRRNRAASELNDRLISELKECRLLLQAYTQVGLAEPE